MGAEGLLVGLALDRVTGATLWGVTPRRGKPSSVTWLEGAEFFGQN